MRGGMLRAEAPRQDVLGTWEHEEVAWVAAVKSRPLGVGTASLTWQTVSSGEPGAQRGVCVLIRGQGRWGRDLASMF